MKDISQKNLKTAVILCGGKGTRLGALGKKIPKTLVKIHKYPIIWYIIKELSKHSINHFILPLGYKCDLIKRYIKKNKEFKNYNIDLIETGLETTISRRIFYSVKEFSQRVVVVVIQRKHEEKTSIFFALFFI